MIEKPAAEPLAALAEGKPYRVLGVRMDRFRYRWFGVLEVEGKAGRLRLPMTGTIAQWFRPGEEVLVALQPQADPQALTFDAYALWRVVDGEAVPIWPFYRERFVLERSSPLSPTPLYRYTVLAREAGLESDFEAIVDLEQHHYASEAEILARWWCPEDRTWAEANARPLCPRCRRPMRFGDLKDATRASRFLVLLLEDRMPYEPLYIGYVRIDPPILMMHRRLPDGTIQPNLRQAVFPADWFEPSFWPERLEEELRRQRPDLSPFDLWWESQEIALKICDTRGARLARVVVHPDYRAEGLGQLALRAAIRWIRERRVPEMRRPKAVLETIAQMARYNPFMERAGFRYLGDTASGRPVLVYPLEEEAARCLERFYETDPVAQTHRGKLYRPAFRPIEPLAGPIRLRHVTYRYESTLRLSGIAPPLQEVLEAFGVHERTIQKIVLKDASLTIHPRQIVAVIGASGAGKTTLLRLIYGAAAGRQDPLYRAQSGIIELPENVQVAAYLPGEIEPDFGGETILEAIYRLTGDEVLAIEVLNVAGIADAVLYRARFWELSTGQKERARIAYLLAARPNLLLIDEFAAHLDPQMALRVARKVAALCRQHGITLIAATHRPEVVQGLEPDLTLTLGYGLLRVSARGD
ncbi:GNAT family N-acetyltransferase [Thermoflexus sp.]|uniref:GNAT family N-acetyltransferase n=1 Tax=Thermoflexus sp. TaxID=1969742 RepID=UPI0035E42D6C